MKIFLESLGCDKNRVDSEEMLGLLQGAGFSFCNDETEADIIIINTCCFIDAAKEESIETILALARMKEIGKCSRLIVTGCMAQRYKDEILKELPEVDAIVGPGDLSQIISAAGGPASSEENKTQKRPRRIITTPGHYEFLRIADGCDKRCTYCVIPYIRGSYRSEKLEELVEEAETLAKEGVRELILVAQETTVYGTDIYGKKMLPELLRRLCGIEGLKWIRVLYTYPEEIDEELLDVMASQEKIVHYLDMPVQHASDDILRRMGRRTSRKELLDTIHMIRSRIPGIALRTSLITGFPGETQADFEALKSFVEEAAFDRLGVFTYSQEEGTPAAAFSDQIPEKVKEKRRDEIMELQARISAGKLSERTGEIFDVFIEGYLPDDEIYVGRTYMDAPDVDGFFYVKSERSLLTGDFIKARCISSGEYDLYGEEIYESAE